MTFLGVVQGITERLAISSTARMRIVSAILCWPEPGAAFSTAMQSAALIAGVSYFWKDVVQLVGGAIGAVLGRRLEDAHLSWRFGLDGFTAADFDVRCRPPPPAS